jgi:hypothetical protein
LSNVEPVPQGERVTVDARGLPGDQLREFGTGGSDRGLATPRAGTESFGADVSGADCLEVGGEFAFPGRDPRSGPIDRGAVVRLVDLESAKLGVRDRSDVVVEKSQRDSGGFPANAAAVDPMARIHGHLRGAATHNVPAATTSHKATE